ncbi:nicotinamidase [Diutina rugosa]
MVSRRMSKRAIVVIDLQNDFVFGTLAVPDAERIIPKINQLISDKSFDLLVATRDWHPPNHTSFATQHEAEPFEQVPFCNPQDSSKIKLETVWPDHCVQNSWGAELVSDFKEAFENSSTPHLLISKGYLVDREYYSAFGDIWGLHQTELDSVLKDHNIDEVVICGLALDYCVFHSALDCAKLGYSTTLYSDLSCAISPKNHGTQISALRSAGVSIKAGPY